MAYKFTLHAHVASELEEGGEHVTSTEVVVQAEHELPRKKEQFKEEVEAEIGFPVEVTTDSEYSIKV